MLAFCTLLLISSCAKSPKKITNTNDYNKYLELAENKTLQTAIDENEFWKAKLEAHPEQFSYLVKIAASYSHLFAITGDISYLKAAETHYLKANTTTNYKKSDVLRALAANYMTQHKFKEALMIATKAELIGDGLQSTQKMIFDIQLELGNYHLAKAYLEKFENMSDFDYLIRLAKWNDHQGNLTAAIKYLEKAKAIAESSNVISNKLWIYTNLADFYGHEGNIKASYNYYLKALKLDPYSAYAKKGIAWIVYSYEKNPDEALRILNSVSTTNKTPSYNLIKAQIADFKGDKKLKDTELKLYETEVKNPDYGNMYNKYNILLLTEKKQNLGDAISIGKIEVKNRPTPESYDLLAWAYYNNGNLQDALKIINNYIANKTYHPESLYHCAKIYKAAGNFDKVNQIKKELASNLYELGPILAQKIDNL
ncbi:MAG: cell surface protein [Gelidibacter sp.]|nr:cell surface protein [Gelidibacter sp.]